MSYSSNVFGSWIILGYILNFIPVSSQESFSLRFLREPPQRLYLQGGSTNQLDCSYGDRGRGTLSHSWYRDEVEVDRQILHSFPNGTLNFDVSISASPQNPYFEGSYRCCITNGTSTLCGLASEVSYPALGPASLVTSRTAAVLAETLRLACNVEGYPTPTVSWSKDGQTLHSMGNRLLILPNNAIQISQVELIDQGSYVCTAGNLAGTTNSDPLVVLVTGLPSDPLYRGQIMNVTSRETVAHVGADILLECLVRDVRGVGVLWTKGTDNIAEDRQETIGHGNLLLTNLSLNDTGTYVCTSYDSAEDKVRTVPVSLTVQAPPTIISSLKVLSPPKESWSRSEGLNAVFHCKASGVPTPTVVWYRDGVRVTMGGRYSQRYTTSLWVRNVQLGDTGLYQCYVTNSLGSVYATSYLEVTRSDLAPMENLRVVSVSSTTVMLAWSTPAPVQPFMGFLVRYTRLQDGTQRDIIRNTSVIYRDWDQTLTKLHPYSNYSISVRTYSLTKLSRQAVVYARTLGAVPTAAPEITNLTSTPTTLTVHWSPTDPDGLNGALVYTEICLERHDHDSLCVSHEAPSLSYTFINLQPGVEYLVRLAAATDAGRGPFSVRSQKITPISVNCTTPDIVPIVSNVVNSSFVSFTWPTSKGAQRGLIRGYRLIISILMQDMGSTRVDFVSLDRGVISYNKTNAVQQSSYSVTFYAFGECGEGPVSSVIIQMPEEVIVDLVNVVPHNIQSRALSTDMIRITWDSPLSDEPIDAYSIEYRIPGQPAKTQMSISREAIIHDLETYTLYLITITATFAWSPREAVSDLHYCRTAEGAPASPPINVWAIPVDSTSLNVSWDRPLIPNGVIVSYTLYYRSPAQADGGWENVARPVYGDRKTGIWLLLSHLRPDTQYSIKVAALTRAGHGPLSLPIDVTTLHSSEGLQFFSQASDVRKGILIGICLALLSIVVCVSLLCYHRRVNCSRCHSIYANRVVMRGDVPLHHQVNLPSYRKREGYPLRRSKHHSWSISDREIESLMLRDLARHQQDRFLVQVHQVDSSAPVRGAHHREHPHTYLDHHTPCDHTSQPLPHEHTTPTPPSHHPPVTEVCQSGHAGLSARESSSSTIHLESSGGEAGRPHSWIVAPPSSTPQEEWEDDICHSGPPQTEAQPGVSKPDTSLVAPTRLDWGELTPPLCQGPSTCECSPYQRRRPQPPERVAAQGARKHVGPVGLPPSGSERDDLSDSSDLSQDRDSGLNRDIAEHSFGGCDTSPDFLERAIELLSIV